jgi:hypothetical protein
MMWEKLNKNMDIFKEGLRQEDDKIHQQHDDKKQEKSNAQLMELMTAMAQKIDDENQALMK